MSAIDIALKPYYLADMVAQSHMSQNEADKVYIRAAIELSQLRTENEQKDKAYQLAVAECVKACKERDMHKRNWENTMEHRDRLSAELELALSILKPLAYKKYNTDVNYFDLVAVTHFVEEHTEPMR